MARLYNIYHPADLRAKLQAEPFERKTLSFYRYVKIADPQTFRDDLYAAWETLGILGRVYIAHEGINAQINIPQPNWDEFIAQINSVPQLQNMYFNEAVHHGKSFIKLTIKVKEKIVADGLNDKTFNPADTGNHLTAEEWNAAMEDPDTIVVDMRNHYESRIGHFENAVTPDADTFREELPMVEETLKGKEDKKVLLYCTGGIRCEKASAYFKYKGFKDVNQLKGGIITYAKDIKQKGLPNKFKGKNFVFDERLAEPISEDVITYCDLCGKQSDRQLNCANEICHLLFIQCEDCADKMQNTCSKECKDFIQKPIKERRKLRKMKRCRDGMENYKNRLRPKIKNINM